MAGPPSYEWQLCESPAWSAPFAPLVKIGNLDDIHNRQFTLTKNRAGSAQFTIRTNHPLVANILDMVDLNDIRGTVRKCLKIRRNDQTIYSGPFWGIQGALDAGTLTISTVGWLEKLYYEMYWGGVPAGTSNPTAADYSNGGNGMPTDFIIFDMLSKVNAQDTAHPLLVQAGTVTAPSGSLPVRNRYYQLGQMLGPAIQELSDIESGVDFQVDPDTRQLDLAAWDSYQTEPGWWGQIRNNIVLGYNWGPNNLKDVQWQEDPSQMEDNIWVQSLGAPVGPIYDPVAQDTYGNFSTLLTPSNMNQTLLQPYAVAELVVKSRPLITWSVFPHPPSQKMPVLFDDFNVGDQIGFTAIKDFVTIKNQAVRVFGANVSLDDNNNETVSALQLSPAAAGGA